MTRVWLGQKCHQRIYSQRRGLTRPCQETLLSCHDTPGPPAVTQTHLVRPISKSTACEFIHHVTSSNRLSTRDFIPWCHVIYYYENIITHYSSRWCITQKYCDWIWFGFEFIDTLKAIFGKRLDELPICHWQKYNNSLSIIKVVVVNISVVALLPSVRHMCRKGAFSLLPTTYNNQDLSYISTLCSLLLCR